MTMPTSQPNRLLEPDFARGFALLGIAIANATTIWALVATMGDNAVPTSIGLIVDNSLGDKIAIFIGAVFVHVRGLPMFATLFGLNSKNKNDERAGHGKRLDIDPKKFENGLAREQEKDENG